MKQFMDENFLLETATAQDLFHNHAAKMPIIDYHCHLIPEMVAKDHKFKSITELWLGGDHYKWRAMRTNGIDEKYCTGTDTSDWEKFEKWAETVPYTFRNPLYHWTHLELKTAFGITKQLSPKTAREIFDECNEKLQQPEYTARGFMRRYNVETVCTTDDPVDDLHNHIEYAKTGALEPLRFDQLSKQMPELEQISADIDVHQFAPPIDSSDMTPRLWSHLVRIIADNYEQYDGFVILHGTDTMAYTASALSFMLENLTKPVILTGSQLPIGQLRTDGKENLITSIEIAATKDAEGHAMVPEVGIYFNGHLLRGNRTTKLSAEEFNAFESFNYPHLAEAGVNITYHHNRILTPDFIQDNIVRHVLDAPELRAIVMRSYGSGNAPQRPWLMKMLSDASNRGVNIINISQCAEGTVEMARYDTGYQLKNAGVISGYDSTVESAVTKLMHLQGHYSDSNIIRMKMNQNLRGEISLRKEE